MEGNKIPEGSQIIGGKEMKPIKQGDAITSENFGSSQFAPDNQYGFGRKRESDAAIKARIEAGNEKGIASMKKKLEDPEEKADGGRIGLLAGSVPKIPAVISALLKNKKKVNQAANNIFPTGDYKLDAEMVAESIVELNPKPFNNMLYDDLDDVTRSEIYGAALSEVSKKNALILQMKKATKPEKTLQSMKEGKGINMSDPDIADEFARFMKETDPKGTKELEQKLQLENFKTKDRSENSDGGRIGLKAGTSKGIIEFFKNMIKPKPRPEFNVEKFRKGPVNLDFLENIDKKDLEPFIRSRDTRGPGGYGMYDNFDDMPAGLQAAELISRIRTKDGRINYEAAELFMGKKLKGNETVDELIQMVTEKEMKADGGRIGLKAGMTKRAFLKLMGAGAAGVGAVKSGLFSIGKGAGKTVAKEVAQQTTSSMPPPYFFKLAEKIKKMGTDVTATTDRTVSKSLLSKDGQSEYILEESLTSGDTLIKKVYKEDDMITNIEIMSLKKGEDVVTKNGKPVRTPDEYEEVTETNSRVYKDEFNDPDYEDGINVDEIIKEVDDQAPPIKYASGGLAYMLGE